VGLVSGDLPAIHAAQAAGCAPVINALAEGLEFPDPVKPHTLAKSIAIGNPADGFQVIRAVKSSGGSGAMATDSEILDAVQLIAETEGIFTEPAGGTTMACALKLIQNGSIPRDESIVVCITGNGYNTAEVMHGRVRAPLQLGRALKWFDGFMEQSGKAPVAQG
jgi:threonine synthase